MATANTCLRDLPDALFELGLIGATTTIVVAGSFRPEHGAGPPDADLPCAANLIDQLPSPIRPQSFRETNILQHGLVQAGRP